MRPRQFKISKFPITAETSRLRSRPGSERNRLIASTIMFSGDSQTVRRCPVRTDVESLGSESVRLEDTRDRTDLCPRALNANTR